MDCPLHHSEDDCDISELSQVRGKSRRKPRKVYHCTAPNCNKSFFKPSQLTYHTDVAHLKLKWFTCIYKNCNKSFYYPTHMKRHMRTHGPSEFYCDLCYAAFSRHHYLKVHQRKCRLLLMCSVCGETFLTNADINKHRQSHCVYLKCLYKDCYEHLAPENIGEHLAGHENVVKCPLCLLMYLDQVNLKEHMAHEHKTEMVTTESYVSDVDVESWLKMMFSDLEKVAGEEDHGSSSSALSAECSPSSGISQERSKSKRCKTNPTSPAAPCVTSQTSFQPDSESPVMYACGEPGCTYSTPTPRWLTKHKLKHRKRGTYKCKVCAKVLVDNWGLTLHMASHSAHKDFPCSFCKESFSSQSRLSQHCQNYHAESRIWKCDECEMKFSTSKRLMAHYRKHVTGDFGKK